MKYVIACCPLTKIFLDQKRIPILDAQGNPTGDYESWQQRCVRDYKIIEDTEIEFDFEVPTCDGAIRFSYNKPHLIQPRPNTDVDTVFEVLAGGKDGLRNPEYDKWGIVPFNIDESVVQKMHEAAFLMNQIDFDDVKKSGKKDPVAAKFERLQKEVKDRNKKAYGDAVMMSYRKVERFIKRNHNYLEKQWEQNAERGVSRYRPSITERLGAISISKMIMKQKDDTASALAEFDRIMAATSGKSY